MVVPGGPAGGASGDDTENSRFTPNAVLLGPGWGRGEDRTRLLESFLPLEQRGVPLILDADAIALAKNITFNGNTLLTPHPGEFAAYIGLPKDEVIGNPLPALRRCAAEKKAHILYKSHVLYVVSPDGRVGIIDGMNPALAAGGSGDVLAGLCAAVAARGSVDCMRRVHTGGMYPETNTLPKQPYPVRSAAGLVDMYACACAAASLLVEAARTKDIAGAFFDPAELAQAAAALAGAAWLPQEMMYE